MKYRISSIKNQISVTFTLFFTVLIIAVTCAVHFTYTSFINQQFLETANHENVLIAKQLETTFDNINNCINSLIIELLSIDEGYLTASTIEASTYMEKMILAIIESNMLIFPQVEQVSIIYTNGNFYQKTYNRSYICASDQDVLLQQLEALNPGASGQWVSEQSFFGDPENTYVYYIKALKNVTANAINGYVILRIPEEDLYTICNTLTNENLKNYYLYDGNGTIVSSDIREWVGQENIYNVLDLTQEDMTQASLTAQHLVCTEGISEDWNFVIQLDSDKLKQIINGYALIIWAVSAALLGVFYVFTVILSRKITNPIMQLADHMRDMGDDLPQIVTCKGESDEVSHLISSFNKMVKTNKRLFAQMETAIRIEQEMRLALLQAQIKPHFLYNTLDTVFCLNSMDRIEESNEVILALSKYYRYILNDGVEWITIGQEVEITSKYLDIQKVRYRDSMECFIELSDEIKDVQIPKLVLQPLVENAIYHGIKPANRKCYIKIIGYLENNMACLKVMDNGVGMPQKVFEGSVHRNIKKENSASVGLASVYHRIHLFCGKNSKMFWQASDEGTTIVIQIENGKTPIS